VEGRTFKESFEIENKVKEGLKDRNGKRTEYSTNELVNYSNYSATKSAGIVL